MAGLLVPGQIRQALLAKLAYKAVEIARFGRIF
jgi:hypothetical protein